MVAVDLREVEDALVALAVVRGDVEAGVDAGLRVDAVRHVAAQLERDDAGDVRRERDDLQVEHQLDVLVVGIRHADRRAGQLARFAR